MVLIRRRHTRWFLLTGKINLKAKSEVPLSDGVLIAIDDFRRNQYDVVVFPPQSGEIERFEDAVVLSQECYKIV